MRKIITSVAVATVAFSTSVIAESDMKVSGHVKLWYQTMDHGAGDAGLFVVDKNEWGDLAAQLKATGSLNDHITYGVALNGVTSMGLENHVVNAETTRGAWRTTSGGVNGKAAQPFWFHEVFIAYKASEKTVVKVGRQELDTPLAYTEKWNATSNSFEAAVVVNSDLPDTTLVGAWVAKGNGATANLVYAPQVFGAETEYTGYMQYNQLITDTNGDGTVDSNDKAFTTRGGALALGAVNTSLGHPDQGWYYMIPDVAAAFWLQGDLGMKDVGPLSSAGLQLIVAGVDTMGATEQLLDTLGTVGMTTAVAAKASASMDIFNAHIAFSQTSEGNVPVANTATNYKKTKIPTASIFSDGMVAAQPDTTAFKIGVGANVDGIGNFALSYGGYNVGSNPNYVVPNANTGGPASMSYIANNVTKADIDLSEIDVVYKTKVKDIDLALMYINVSKTYVPGGTLGTEANQIVRAIAQLNF